MNPLLLRLALLVAAFPAWAQTEAVEQAERAHIAAQRGQAETRLAAEEVACYRVFAVNDCLKAARARSRERLSALRRQELRLNDAERKRRTAERLELEERRAAQEQEDGAARRAEAVMRQQDKKEELDKRAAERARTAASGSASMPAPGGVPRPAKAAKPPSSHDTAQELRRTQERLQDAKERQERAAKRQAEAASKPDVKPLPVPP